MTKLKLLFQVYCENTTHASKHGRSTTHSSSVGSHYSMEDITQEFLRFGAIHADNSDNGIPVAGRRGKADLELHLESLQQKFPLQSREILLSKALELVNRHSKEGLCGAAVNAGPFHGSRVVRPGDRYVELLRRLWLCLSHRHGAGPVRADRFVGPQTEVAVATT